MFEKTIEPFFIALGFYLAFFIPAKFLIKEPHIYKIGRRK